MATVCSRASLLLLENVSFCFVFRYLIADAQTVLCALSTVTESVEIQRTITLLKS
jgi:hypothetical protein